MNTRRTHTFRRLTHLGDIPVDVFLKDYWQKKPLLVRKAFPNFVSPVSADELAGFAIDDDVVSRLIIEDRPNKRWNLQHGPLSDNIFSQLPNFNWTLLVQHADLLDPEVNALMDAFQFIPRWRIDDIMISYATNGGGVGPHFDYYDVFLLQAQGKRRWRLGQACSSESQLLPGIDLKILKEFDTQYDWVVEPGDLLYIPPGIAHWGESIDESITYSVGFRAPSYGDIVLDFAEEMASLTNNDQRYSDPDLSQQRLSGEISTHTIEKVQQILSKFSNNKAYLANWFGEYMTRPNPGGHESSRSELRSEDLAQTPLCRLNPFARSAFCETSDHCIVYINGYHWHCSKPLAVMLSEYEAMEFNAMSEQDKYILNHLANEGLLEAIDD